MMASLAALMFVLIDSLVASMFVWVNLNFVANFLPHNFSQAICLYVVEAAITSQIPLLSWQATPSVPKSPSPRVAHFITTFAVLTPASTLQTAPWVAWQIASILEAAYPHSVVQSSYVS